MPADKAQRVQSGLHSVIGEWMEINAPEEAYAELIDNIMAMLEEKDVL